MRRLVAILLAGAFVSVIGPACRADEGLLPRRQLFPDFATARYRFSVILSPDGQRLSWIVRDKDSTSLWTSGADGTGERQQTATRGAGEFLSCRWAYTN